MLLKSFWLSVQRIPNEWILSSSASRSWYKFLEKNAQPFPCKFPNASPGFQLQNENDKMMTTIGFRESIDIGYIANVTVAT